MSKLLTTAIAVFLWAFISPAQSNINTDTVEYQLQGDRYTIYSCIAIEKYNDQLVIPAKIERPNMKADQPVLVLDRATYDYSSGCLTFQITLERLALYGTIEDYLETIIDLETVIVSDISNKK